MDINIQNGAKQYVNPSISALDLLTVWKQHRAATTHAISLKTSVNLVPLCRKLDRNSPRGSGHFVETMSLRLFS